MYFNFKRKLLEKCLPNDLTGQTFLYCRNLENNNCNKCLIVRNEIVNIFFVVINKRINHTHNQFQHLDVKSLLKDIATGNLRLKRAAIKIHFLELLKQLLTLFYIN